MFWESQKLERNTTAIENSQTLGQALAGSTKGNNRNIRGSDRTSNSKVHTGKIQVSKTLTISSRTFAERLPFISEIKMGRLTKLSIMRMMIDLTLMNKRRTRDTKILRNIELTLSDQQEKRHKISIKNLMIFKKIPNLKTLTLFKTFTMIGSQV